MNLPKIIALDSNNNFCQKPGRNYQKKRFLRFRTETNYETIVQVRNLAPPERLSPPRKVYVVWMDTEQSRTNHVGQLRTKSKMFSRSYNAELKTVSSRKPTRVFVTAEDVAEIQYPGSQVVLDTQNF